MKTLYIIFLITFNYTISAQSEAIINEEIDEELDERVGLFEGGFSLYLPTGTYKEKLGVSSRSGFNLGYFYQLIPENPAFIGVEFYYMYIGKVSKEYVDIIDNESIDISGTIVSQSLGINLIGRYYPSIQIGIVEPYFEGRLGPKWMNTFLNESGVFFNDELYEESDFVEGDIVLSYGFGAGIQIDLKSNVYFNFKTVFQNSLSGEYYSLKSKAEIEQAYFPSNGLAKKIGPTNTVRFDFGVTVVF
ncbi:MAG: hypothetical protein V3V14_01130 [Saprospiraceae bacterium]